MADLPSANSVARFVRWVIILFFAYAFWHNFNMPKTTSAPGNVQSRQTATKGKDCDNNARQNFSAFPMALLPRALPALSIQDSKEGKGPPAECGQTATLRYELATRNGAIIFSDLQSKKPPENSRIGSHVMLPGIEKGLIGMKPGGERSISMPPALAFAGVKNVAALRNQAEFVFPPSLDMKKESVTAKVRLLALSPAVPDSAMQVRMIDTSIGGSKRAECGDTITADMTVWKMDGSQLFSTINTKPLTFTLGASQVPLGIEQGVTGMSEGSERTLIIPPAYAKPLDPSATQVLGKFSLPEHEMVLVDIIRLPAVENPPALPPKK